MPLIFSSILELKVYANLFLDCSRCFWHLTYASLVAEQTQLEVLFIFGRHYRYYARNIQISSGRT